MWCITKDHLDHKDVEVCSRDYDPATFGNDKTVPFKLYDDDQELYYTGRMSLKRFNSGDEPGPFGPLDDYGMPNAGCTELRYRDPKDGKWRTL